MESNADIILYESTDKKMSLSVRVEEETVWLTANQMADLFGRDSKTIRKHINNVFAEGELDYTSNTQKMRVGGVDQSVAFYTLDVIISVGYRVKSQRRTQFRIWANQVLKDYLLKGYTINKRLENIESTLENQTKTLEKHENQIEISVKTSLPSLEEIFYDGQIFDAYVFVSNLIKSDKHTIVLIDNYIDESVLLLLVKRKVNVDAFIYLFYSQTNNRQFNLDIQKYNSQYPPINVCIFKQATTDF